MQSFLPLSLYSTVELYITTMKVLIFMPTQSQLNIYFKESRQYWLETTKPKNVFRSTINPSNKLI